MQRGLPFAPLLSLDIADLPLEIRFTKPAESVLPTDEEGTPDIYKTLLQLLHKLRESRKLIDEYIEEKASPDWRAEHNDKYGDSFKILGSHLTNVSLQHSFVPRIGELVLWCPDHPDDVDIIYNPEIHGYQFYSPERQTFHGFPRWRGGVVTQCPSTDESVDFPDVLCVVDRKDSLNRAGFRVETFPDPNNDVDKSASKQYKYVPLRQIRPLNHWQRVLHGIPEHKLDPSIRYALTGMVSLSLLEKYRFVGKWPEASIFCKGIYVGAELLIEGDAVRILPSERESSAQPLRCTDVLVISSIRLHLHDINEEHISNRFPGFSRATSITLVGTAYTLDSSRAYSEESATSANASPPQPVATDVIKYALPTVGAAAYGNWYALHSPKHKIEITHDRILGRLHESGAMGMWSGTLGDRGTYREPPSLSYDLSSVLAGRKYGTLTDDRIPEARDGKIHWHWADTRVKALSLETVNGIEVGAYDTVRDLRTMQAWRARLKIIDGLHTQADVKDSMLAKQKGRPKGSRVIGGVVVGPDEESGSEEVDPPTKGSFSEAVRSKKGVGGMVGAGAAIEEDDNDEDKEPGGELANGDTEDEESPTYPSKVNIMEPKHERTSSRFVIRDDSDIDIQDHPPLGKRPISNIPSEIRGPTKARKSTGGSRLPSVYAGRYDSSITPAMTQEEILGPDWKGKGRADAVQADYNPDTPFRTVEPDNAILIEDDNNIDSSDDTDEEDMEEEFYLAGDYVEPEPKDDDDYDEDEDEDGDRKEDEDATDEEEERIRTLAIFQKDTFDRTGKKIAF